MAITRTIYTQGVVKLKGPDGGAVWMGTALTGTAGVTLSGVQSANLTYNQPRQDVNSFGVLGAINKVQVEPSQATMEVSMIVNSGNANSNWLSGLALDTQKPTPSGITVTASGVGELTNAILTAIRLEAAVGAVPTIAITLEGILSANHTGVLAAGTAPTGLFVGSVPVTTPDQIDDIWWNTDPLGGWTGCPQSVRASWEMPVERINCLGNDVDKPSVYSRPPGTMSFTAEGIDYHLHGSYLTGLKVGPYTMAYNGGGVRETTRTSNMAVGEASATYNVTSEAVALGAVIGGA